MSIRKYELLRLLENSFGEIRESLLYRLLESADHIQTEDNTIRIIVKRNVGFASTLLDAFWPKVILLIEIILDKINIRLPYYHSEILYSCNVNQSYVKDGNIRLINVMNNIYFSLISKLKNNACVNINEAIFLAGILPRESFYILKIYYQDVIYIDNSARIKLSFNTLFHKIINTDYKYNVYDIISCFSGVINDLDNINENIIYLRNQNITDISQLKKYKSLLYVDIETKCDINEILNCNFKSVKINGNQIVGIDPLTSFLTKN